MVGNYLRYKSSYNDVEGGWFHVQLKPVHGEYVQNCALYVVGF